jgi:aminomuconate-semialdehyde/2-hydroxymuconate-6-semialdehyde dehydrogenase
MQRVLNYMNGELVGPASGQWLDNLDPAIGEVYATLPDSDERDVQSAVDAAEEAFPRWSAMAAQERSRIMLRIADLIDANLDRLARAECIDSGKPISLAKALDIPRAASNIWQIAVG